MNFDSHTDTVVGLTVALVNVATPGARHGRAYPQPQGTDLVAAIGTALGNRDGLDDVQARKLAAAAARLRGVFEAAGRGDVDDAAGRVNALLDDLQPAPYLSRHDGEPWHLHFHSRHHDYADSWAAGCTVALATVLGGEYADRLGVCSAGGCDRVYVDVSRNGTRRFCSTACQNRVKAALHRARAAG